MNTPIDEAEQRAFEYLDAGAALQQPCVTDTAVEDELERERNALHAFAVTVPEKMAEIREIGLKMHAFTTINDGLAALATAYCAQHLSDDERQVLLDYYRSDEGLGFSQAMGHNAKKRVGLAMGYRMMFSLIKDVYASMWNSFHESRNRFHHAYHRD